jgi:DNA repair exonuclease SbcCD ATPase subunit
MQTTPLYGKAARQPLAILVLLAAIVAGVAVALWLLPLGVLAYTAMVLLAARDPALQSSVVQPPRPGRPRLSSPTFKAQLQAIERTQQEIARSAGQAHGPLARLLGPVSDQARDLLDDAYHLSGKGQIIETYLAGVDLARLQREIAALDAQLQNTQDPYTRQQLEETRQARLEKLANARDLQTYIGRISAQLQNIAASLDNVLAETVRLRTADAVSADAAGSQVAGRLADLKADMDAFQAVLDTAMTQTAGVG